MVFASIIRTLCSSGTAAEGADSEQRQPTSLPASQNCRSGTRLLAASSPGFITLLFIWKPTLRPLSDASIHP
ncbi:hypothetical protein VTO58DRAFT_106106 [Aureobasidium pullulans]